MEYSVVGRTIYPGMVVDILIQAGTSIDPCPGVFRAIELRSGSAYLSLDGRKRFIEAPALLCLDGREELEPIKSDGCSCRVVYFKPCVVHFQLDRETALLPPAERFASPFVQDLFWLDPFVLREKSDGILRLDPASAERVSCLLELLQKSLEEQTDLYWPCRSRSYFLEFLFLARHLASMAETGSLLGPREQTCPGAELPGKLEDILLFLHTNFRKRIGLDSMCRQFAINRTSLNELFRRHLGQTAIQYLIGLRIRFACLLLRDTTVPVKELVRRAGFNDLVHFSRTFKKITARTPIEYRKEFCFMLSN